MKKQIVLVVMCFISIFTYAQDSFVFDGIEFHDTKGWNFSPTQNSFMTQITGVKTKFSYPAPKIYQIVVTKFQEPTEGINLEEYLQENIGQLSMATMTGQGKYSLKIESIGNIYNGSINGNSAIYTDVIYDRKLGIEMKTRIYVFKIENEIFSIACTGRGSKKKDAWISEFEDLLSTFYYTPIE